MTMHLCNDTLHAMTKSWQIEYLQYVARKTGKSLSGLAELAGVSSTTLTRPVNNPDHAHNIKMTTLEKIEHATGIRFDEFRDTVVRVDRSPERGEPGLVPVYDVQASAGNGVLAPDYETIAYSLAFPPDYLRKIVKGDPQNLKIISVKGDSMSPTLEDDDIVMVDTSKRNIGYDGMFVVRHLDVIKVKRVRLSVDRQIIALHSDNATLHPPEHCSVEDIEIIGRVVWVGGKV